MPSLPILFAPIALLLPFGWHYADDRHISDADVTAQQTRDEGKGTARLPVSREAPAWSPIYDGIFPPKAEQVRIERRVVLRISPARTSPRQSLVDNAEPERKMRVVERDAGKCIDSSRIGAVADRGGRLILLMRDRRTIAVRLEKGCSSRDFYHGAYMERSEDGRLCVQRDRLMSRAGAKCQVARFTELVVEPAP